MDHVSWDVPTDFVNPQAISQDPAFTNAFAPHNVFTNLLDNGAMNVAQRGTSLAALSGVSGVRLIDRWNSQAGLLGTWTISQDASAPAGTGLTKSLKYLCTTANAAPGAGLYQLIGQSLEGQDVQHLQFGTSAAKTVTCSFWVKSTTVGTYIAELYDFAGVANSFMSRAYTINVANTWEYKTLTWPGDTTQAPQNNASLGMSVQFWLAASSTYAGGASLGSGAYHGDDNTRAVGQTNLAAAVNNSWQITGVQLEVGAKATVFEQRRYGDEMQRCQRYVTVWPNQMPLRGVVASDGTPNRMGMVLPVEMRALPVLTLASGTYNFYDGVGTLSLGVAPTVLYGDTKVVEFNWGTSFAAPVPGRGCVMYSLAGVQVLSAEI